MKAPILDRHEQAAMRALIPHDGAAVHMELGQESESARARRMAVAQAIAQAEFNERVRCAWGTVGAENAARPEFAAVEDALAEIADDADVAADFWDARPEWDLCGDPPEEVRDLVLRGWK